MKDACEAQGDAGDGGGLHTKEKKQNSVGREGRAVWSKREIQQNFASSFAVKKRQADKKYLTVVCTKLSLSNKNSFHRPVRAD